MNILKQTSAVTAMNFSALRDRMGLSLVVVVSMAAVVGVMLSVLSMSSGMIRLGASSMSPTRVLIVNKGSQGEGTSLVSRASVLAILDTPGIKRSADGKPIASGDVTAFAPAVRKSDGLDTTVSLRGVGPNYFALRPELKMVEGRMYTPGLHELIVGSGVRDVYEGFTVGSDIRLQDGLWKIVGVFATDSLWGTTILVDADTLITAFRRNNFASVTVDIEPGDAAFNAFKESLMTNPQLAVEVIKESAYYENAFKGQADFLRMIAYMVGGVMALGAVFGALITMFAAVSKRTLEIATLRAIGFSSTPVVISIVAEAVTLAVLGAVVGGAFAWLAFNGRSSFMQNMQFKLVIAPEMFAIGIAAALAVGLVGALFPAIRAARLPVATALQAR